MKKSELRQTYLSRQKAISQQYRLANSEAIADLLFATYDLRGIRFLHTFIPIIKLNEVDTTLIVERVWRDYPHTQIVVPRVDRERNEMKSLVFGPDTKLVRSAWEIDEPDHEDVVADADIDMVLTPGLCFDRDGHRVGYGKGFYDRFLKRCRTDCVKIGLGHFALVDTIEEVQVWDVRLDAVVTPDGVFDTGQNRER